MFSILIVDDEPDNFDVIEAFLCEHNYQLHYAAHGKAALQFLDIASPDLILLDVMMPGMDGLEVCRRIKAMPQGKGVPVIMVTALSDKEDLARCLAAGADDFISKPVNRIELEARVRSMLRIHEQYQQLETFNARLEVLVQQRTAQLQDMIFQDRLTQLPSRALLLQKLADLLNPVSTCLGSQNHSTEPLIALIYLDCDQFQLVNGSFGHEAGDQLLVAIAQRLRQHCQSGDFLARPGEDEFCFVHYAAKNRQDIEQVVLQLMDSFHAPFSIVTQDITCEIFMTMCVGVAFGFSGDNAETVLQDADTAMYQAKLRGKGNYQIFERQMQLAILNRLTLESDLKRAVDQQEFFVHYQPIVNLETLKIFAFEALMRWRHPTRGIVPPGEFIPSIETTGLIVRVGMDIFKQACAQLARWHRMGWDDLIMSINLSVRQFESPTLLTNIDRILAETKVNPACIKLEITETAIMKKASGAIALMEELRSRRMQLSIDDFGTGYSSLGYLYEFPVNTLKIDQSFVSDTHHQNRQYQVVDTIISLGKQLNLDVIAEGIETPQQLAWLKQLDCQFGQGYLFSKPLSPEQIEQKYLSSAIRRANRPILCYESQPTFP